MQQRRQSSSFERTTHEGEVEVIRGAFARDHGPKGDAEREDVSRLVLAIAQIRLRGQKAVRVRLRKNEEQTRRKSFWADLEFQNGGEAPRNLIEVDCLPFSEKTGWRGFGRIENML